MALARATQGTGPVSSGVLPQKLLKRDQEEKMRLVTRGDLDGVTSAVLLTTMEKIYSIELVHP